MIITLKLVYRYGHGRFFCSKWENWEVTYFHVVDVRKSEDTDAFGFLIWYDVSIDPPALFIYFWTQ